MKDLFLKNGRGLFETEDTITVCEAPDAEAWQAIEDALEDSLKFK